MANEKKENQEKDFVERTKCRHGNPLTASCEECRKMALAKPATDPTAILALHEENIFLVKRLAELAAKPAVGPQADVLFQGRTIARITCALAKAQAEFLEIKKTKTATIESRKEGARSYEYQYADLADVLSATRPALAKNGLALVQLTEYNQAGKEMFNTYLFHESGEYFAGKRFMPVWTDAKQLGGWMTYIRRYDASAMLGVASQEDTDAALTNGQQPQNEGHRGKHQNANKGQGKQQQTSQAPQGGAKGPANATQGAGNSEQDVAAVREAIAVKVEGLGWAFGHLLAFIKENYKVEDPYALNLGQLKNLQNRLEKNPSKPAVDLAEPPASVDLTPPAQGGGGGGSARPQFEA